MTSSIYKSLVSKAAIFRVSKHPVGRAGLLAVIASAGLAGHAVAQDLQVSRYQVVSPADPIANGSRIVLEVDVENNEIVSVSGAELTIDVAETMLVLAPDVPAACSADGFTAPQVLTCSLPTLTRNSSAADFTFSYIATAQNANALPTTATVSNFGGIDLNAGNDFLTFTPTITSGADLSVTAASSVASIAASGEFDFTFVANNGGPDSVSEVMASISLPPANGFGFETATGTNWTCAFNGGASQSVTCDYSGPAITAGNDFPTITVTGTADAATGTLSAQADIAITQIGTGDPDASNDVSNTAVVTVTPGTDLQAGVVINPTFITGDTGTYEVSIFNNGPTDIGAGATITHSLDPNLTLNGPLPAGCTIAAPVVTCTAGPLAETATERFTIPVTAATDTGGNRTISATVAPPSGITDPVSSNDTRSDQFRIDDPAADLQLRSKTKTPNPVAAGGTLTSTIRVRNLGPSAVNWTPAEPIIVTDDLVAGETFSNTTSANVSCTTGPSPVGGFATRVTCQTTDSGTLALNTNKDFVIRSVAGAGTDLSLTNSACVDPSSLPLADNNAGNNCGNATSRATTEAANLSIATRVSLSAGSGFVKDETVPAGNAPHFIEIVVTNDAGGDTARTVQVSNDLTSWLNQTIAFNGGSVNNRTTVSIASSDAGVTCPMLAASNNRIRCTVTNLDPGTSRTFVLRVDRELLAGDRRHTFTVSSTDTTETDNSDNSDFVDVDVVPNADLIVNDKRVNPDPLRSGGFGNYIVDILNIGPNDGQASVATDFIDTSLFEVLGVTTTAPGGVCDFGTTTPETATCVLGEVESAETFQMNIQVRPRFPFSGANDPGDFPVSHINTANISTSTFDLNNANDMRSLTHDIAEPSVDIAVSNNEPAGFIEPSVYLRPLLYEVITRNLGITRGTGISTVVTPNPAAGYEMALNLADSTIPADVTCTQASNTDPVICAMPDLSNAENRAVILAFDTVDAGGGAPTNSVTFGTTAVVTSDQQVFDNPLGNNNAAQTTTILPSTDLEVVSKTRISPAPPASININEPVVYDIVFRNNGPSATTQVRMIDTLPDGFARTATAITFTPNGSATVSGSTCSAGPVVTCSVDGFFPATGDLVTMQIEARAVFPFTGDLNDPIVNTAEIRAGLDGFGDPISSDEVAGNNTAQTSDGVALAGSISGRVFNDADRSGAFNAGEGIGSVTLTLTGRDSFNNPITTTVTTNNDGTYIFEGLPPSDANGYTVTETQPANHFDSIEIVGDTGGAADNTGFDNTPARNRFTGIVLGENVDASGYQFAEFREASVRGFIYSDANNNGERDGGEPGISAGYPSTPHVRLTGTDYAGNPVLVNDTVNGSGRFDFSDLPPSDASGYTVTQLAEPDNFLDGLEENGSGNVITGSVDSTETLTLGQVDPGDTLTERNFGQIEASSFAGVVYLDANGGGTREAGETSRVSGAVVTLTGTNDLNQAVSCTVTTGANGAFSFPVAACPDLRPGTYQLELTNTGGGTATGATAGSEGGTAATTTVSAITIAPGATGTDYDFGVQGSGLSGAVFVEANATPSRQAVEVGIPNVSVTLSGQTAGGQDVCTLITCTVQTDATGAFSFANVPASDATGYTLTQQSQGAAPLSAYSDDHEIPGTVAGTTTGAAGNDVFTGIVMGANEAGSGYLFGETASSLSGLVFIDAAGDGSPAGDGGLEGVTVTLSGTTAFGTDICTYLTSLAPAGSCTAVTAVDGTYTFPNLPAGTYTLTETQPTGFADGQETAGSAGGSTADNVISGIGLGVGTAATGYNFAEIAASLSGSVYIDLDDDGLREAGEPGIEGVTVTLSGNVNGGGDVCAVLAARVPAGSCTVTSDVNGNYAFGLIPEGNYTLTETQPVEFNDGRENAGTSGGTINSAGFGPGANFNAISNIALGSGGSATGLTFGELGATISGTVFYDSDRDADTTGESGLVGVTIELVNASGVVIDTFVTLADGSYEFEGIPPGNYTVRQVQPAGYGSSTPSSVAITAVAATPTVVDFGETLSTLAGSVFIDTDRNAARATGETGIQGVSVTLTGTDDAGANITVTIQTDASGNFLFEDLLSGTYTLTEAQPADFADGNESAGSSGGTVGDDEISGIALGEAVDATGYGFAELPAGLSGTVYADFDRDGTQGPDDGPIAGVELVLFDNLGVEVGRTTTGVDGSYTFADLPQGTYTLRQIQPDGYGEGEENGTSEVEITLTPGNLPDPINFGETVGSFSGSVFNDIDGNGTQDSSDPALPGVTILLTGTDARGNPVDLETVTDETGNYTFPNIVGGTYTITEVQPDNLDDAADFAGSAGGTVGNDAISAISLGAAVDATGYVFTETGANASISGSVWRDLNHDRVNDAGSEEQVPNWIVNLYFAGEIVATTTTDANGDYTITDIPPGAGYELQFVNPSNNAVLGGASANETGAEFEDGVASEANPGGATRAIGSLTNITLAGGQELTEQSLPLDPSGVVYDALTREPVAGATVTITGPAGFDPELHLVGGLANVNQLTGEDGIYQYLFFLTAPAGEYSLSIVPPEGYNPVTPSALIPACPSPISVGATPDPFLIQLSSTAPAADLPQSCVPGQNSTAYFLSFNLTPGVSADVLNNHIPIDPFTGETLVVTKESPYLRVSRGGFAPYTISITNTASGPVLDATVFDRLPAGFKFVDGSALVDGAPIVPTGDGRSLAFEGIDFTANQTRTIDLVAVVGSGVSEGEQTNQAFVLDGATGTPISNIGEATLRVEPDPDFDCTDILGKVFNDLNGNGYQDEGEPGIPGVRLATVNGLLITTDGEGRYHIACAAVPNEDRGSNFVLKVDTRTLPTGYRMTTDNPHTVRLTRGKFAKMNFGASLLRVMNVTLSETAFDANTPIEDLIAALEGMVPELEATPSVVRLSYLRGDESRRTVSRRLRAVRRAMRKAWRTDGRGRAQLMIEDEIVRLSSLSAQSPDATVSSDVSDRVLVEPERGARRLAPVVDRETVSPNLEQQSGAVGVAAPDEAAGFTISLDGMATTGEGVSTAGTVDAQRRADVALQDASITMSFDALTVSPVLNIVSEASAAQIGQPINFYAFSNYGLFLERAEVRLFAPGDTTRQAPLVVLPAALDTPISWTPETRQYEAVQFVLRVYDANGRFDETLPQLLPVVEVELEDPSNMADLPGENRLAVHSIPLEGGTVTVHVEDLSEEQSVQVMGLNAAVDTKGQAFAQHIVPHGESAVAISITEADGSARNYLRDINVASDDSFFVALADLSIGARDLSGAFDEFTPADDDTDRDSDFVQGRLAFYYRGKVRGDVLLTASADTGEEDIDDLFSNFDEKDARSFLRRIDPNRFYAVYGDDSTTVEDAPTQGKFYVRLEKGQNSILWGNFQTLQTGTEFTNYSRSLYGGQLRLETEAVTSYGEARAELSAFAADPGTLSTREELRGTGGSVFYLRNQDIVAGSERIFVEVRDRDSGLVVSREELIPARDFDLNYIQGRVTLRSPLSTNSDGVLFVRDASLTGNPQFLVVTYEFTTTLTRPDTFATGGRATNWLNDYVQVGISGFNQNDEAQDQTLYGADVTFRYKPGTYVRIEAAESRGAGSDVFSSVTGGFDFNNISPTTNQDETAGAQRVEAAVDLSELNDKLDGRLSAYWQNRGEGFSGPGQITFGESVSQYGVLANINLIDRTSVTFKSDVRDGASISTKAIEGGVRHSLKNGVFGAIGVRSDDREGQLQTASPTLNDRGSRTDANLQLGYDTRLVADEIDRRDWSAYVFGQLTLETGGNRDENDRVGFGGDVQLNQRISLDGEISTGDLGLGAKLGSEYRFSDNSSVYLGYALQAETQDAFNTGRLGQLTGGVKTRYTDNISVFAEGRYNHGQGPTGLTQNYGLDFTPGERWSYGVTFETGELSDPNTGDISRDAVTGSVGFSDEDVTASALVEFRQDDSDQIGNRDIFAWRASSSYQVSDDWRAYANVNGSNANAQANNALDANFLEVTMAGAYRPVLNDRFNGLMKYVYLEDLPAGGQVSASGRFVDFAQRSHVFSADGTYQLTPWFAAGGKIAYRRSDLRLSREPDAPFFASEAVFFALRGDITIVKEWDILMEARRLSVSQAQDSRFGGVVGIYRHLGDDFKFGVGYNFADFSDDLTDLDFNERGVFINLLGAF